MKLVKVTYADVPEIMLVYKDVIKNTFTTWDENYPREEVVREDIDDGNFYVLKENGKIIAVSFLGTKKKDVEIWKYKLAKPMGVARICVSPKCQGKGIGTKFMQMLIAEARLRGADGMHFHVCTTNVSAMKMYEKCGFAHNGEIVHNYGFDFYKYELVF